MNDWISTLCRNVMFAFLRKCRIEYQLHNLVVGALTRENMYAAFDHGITADQVMSHASFLLIIYRISSFSKFHQSHTLLYKRCSIFLIRKIYELYLYFNWYNAKHVYCIRPWYHSISSIVPCLFLLIVYWILVIFLRFIDHMQCYIIYV